MESMPQEAVIELTNFCNLACIMCPQKAMLRQKGYMNQTLFQKIVDQLAGKCELVYLYGTGESLLHKELINYIDYVKGRGMATCLSTNGQLLTEEKAVTLLGSGLDHLIVALDGGTKDTYEKIRIKGDFELLINNIRFLLKIKNRFGSTTRICLQMIYMPQNAHEIKIFRDLFGREEHQAVSSFRFKPLYETYALGYKPICHTRPCFWLWNMISIHWNGNVALCCMDADAVYRLGNLNDQSVMEVWNSQQLQDIRKKHLAINYDDVCLCATCDIPEQGYFNRMTIAGSTFISVSGTQPSAVL
jgi:Predicted Fe-S oxidoreductases